MWAWIILMAAVIIMAVFYMRCKKPIRSILFGVGSGLVTMGAVAMMCSGLLQFNLFTVLFSAVAGIPGVLAVIFLGRYII